MFYRFLLPYERHTKGQEEKHVKRRESDSGSDKVMKDSGFRIPDSGFWKEKNKKTIFSIALSNKN